MADLKPVKTSLGELKFDEKNNHYVMSSEQLYKRMEDAGVPNAKETTKAFMEAKDKVLQDLAHFVSDQSVKTGEDVSISAGIMPFRLEADSTIVKEVNIPGRDGAPTTRKTVYGTVSAKMATKTPNFIKEDPYLKKNQDEIEAAWLKKHGDKIKIA